MAIAGQDFGRSRRRWLGWWHGHADRPRTEWLIEGLRHREPAVRAAAAEELRPLVGNLYGYRPDLPRPAREAAAKRISVWWETVGRRSGGGGTPVAPERESG